MPGQIWNFDLHRKNLAGTMDAGRCPVEKHRPVGFGRVRSCRNRNIIIEDRFEIDANAVGLAAPYDRLAHGEPLRNLLERQIGEIEGEHRLWLAKQKLDISWIDLTEVVGAPRRDRRFRKFEAVKGLFLNQWNSLLFQQLNRLEIKLELRRQDTPAGFQAAVTHIENGFHHSLVKKRDPHLLLDDHVNRFHRTKFVAL